MSGVENVDLEALAPITGLRRLNLSRTRGVGGLLQIRRLTGLRQLSLMESGIKSLAPLAALVNLEELDISRTAIDDLAPLAKLASLKRLSAPMTQVADLTPLRGLSNLDALDVSFTSVRDLAPLAALEKLQQLDVSNTAVADLSPLGRLTVLKELNLSRTRIAKDKLKPLLALASLKTLALDGTGVRDFNSDGRIAGLKMLQDPALAKPVAAYRAGDSFRDCAKCPVMVVVPAGSFDMGLPEEETGRFYEEGPQRKVTIPRSFAVGKFEVRIDEWMQCVRDEECRMVADESWGRGARPVMDISWNDAKRYVAWLAKKTGKSYRLLTEAEWEYVARAGTVDSRYWGSSNRDACKYANVADHSAKSKYKELQFFDCDDFYPESAPVGMFRPNAFGLHDTLGNVWEWVEDCFVGSYENAPVDGSASLTTDCAARVGLAAVDGKTVCRTCGLPSATEIPLSSASISWVFVLPGCSILEALHPYPLSSMSEEQDQTRRRGPALERPYRFLRLGRASAREISAQPALSARYGFRWMGRGAAPKPIVLNRTPKWVCPDFMVRSMIGS